MGEDGVWVRMGCLSGEIGGNKRLSEKIVFG